MLYEALRHGQSLISQGAHDAPQVRQAMLDCLAASAPAMQIEYLEVVDPSTMTPLETISGPALIAAAVWLGKTRLIDNLLCG